MIDSNKNMKKCFCDFEYRPIVVSKMMLDMMLRTKKPNNVIALFLFYAYTRVWQRTNLAKCSVNYASKGLGISVRAVREAKTELIQIGLAKEIKRCVMKNGRNTIQYYMKVLYKDSSKSYKLYPVDFSNSTKNAALHKRQTNAKNTNNLNAKRANRINKEGRLRRPSKNKEPLFHDETMPRLPINNTPPPKKSKSYILAKRLIRIITKNNMLVSKDPSPEKWARDIDALRNSPSAPDYDEIIEKMDILERYGKDPWCPDINSADSFHFKFDKLRRFKIRLDNQQSSTSSSNNNITPAEPKLFTKENRRKAGTPCDLCDDSNVKVYLLREPGSYLLKNICRHCYKIRESGEYYRKEEEAED